MSETTLRNYIGGAWIESTGTRAREVVNPATGVPLARVPMSAQADVDRAVSVALEAFDTWRQVPAIARARTLFRYKNLLEKNFEELARVVNAEHGKTLDEARGSIRRSIENVEHACGIPSLMMGDSLEDVAAGIDCETVRQPIGVFAAVAPSNFPAMVPLWFWPIAVATGNTFIVKPSEQVPVSQQLMFEMAHEAGFPAGVVNMVHGDQVVVDALVKHPDVAGVSFVGSTAVARSVYEKAAAAGKRVQAFGGAKNHSVVMPDAHLERTVESVIDSAFGCTGQRCLAGSVVVGVGDVHDELLERLVARASRIVVGNGADSGVAMGPMTSAHGLDRVMSKIHQGVAEGGRLVLDGRGVEVQTCPDGHFIGPTIFADVTSEMAIAREEIFGPVLIVRRADTLDDAIAMIRASELANATSIFTSSGKNARHFRTRVGVSMIGVNIGVAAPMAFFPFGGTKQSFFGDIKAHGSDAIRFFTDQKVVISRWF